jgi:hypothetical protein
MPVYFYIRRWKVNFKIMLIYLVSNTVDGSWKDHKICNIPLSTEPLSNVYTVKPVSTAGGATGRHAAPPHDSVHVPNKQIVN